MERDRDAESCAATSRTKIRAKRPQTRDRLVGDQPQPDRDRMREKEKEEVREGERRREEEKLAWISFSRTDSVDELVNRDSLIV